MGHRYLKGILDEVELDGEIIRMPVDSNGETVGISQKSSIRIKAFATVSDVPAVALFKQSKRDSYRPPGWTTLTPAQFEAEFLALKGRLPTPEEC